MIVSFPPYLENDKAKIDKLLEKVTQLNIDIERKFETTRFQSNQTLKVQKLKKDFKTKMAFYEKMLEQYRDNKDHQLRELRKSVQYSRSIRPNKKTHDSSEDEEGNTQKQIQLEPVNQETLFQEHLIELKEKQLIEINQKMKSALNVQTQLGKLVHEQGQQLDQIEENVDSARSNVKDGADFLEDGVKHHKSANKKKFCIIGVVFVLLLVIIIPIMVKVL